MDLQVLTLSILAVGFIRTKKGLDFWFNPFFDGAEKIVFFMFLLGMTWF